MTLWKQLIYRFVYFSFCLNLVPTMLLAQGTPLKNVTQISVGERYTCALLNDGTIKCWGEGDDGKLGNGSSIPQLVPESVKGINKAIQIETGHVHTCALLEDNTLKCWGSGKNHQLGNGMADTQIPQASVSDINNAAQISIGFDHSCAFLKNNSVKCWGQDTHGLLGNGYTPEDVQITPVFVNGINNVTQISISMYQTCTLLNNGTIKCWGENTYGQLGNGNTLHQVTPVLVNGINNATQISTGYNHTCALLSNNTIKCWGANTYGQLGNRETSDQTTPVLVSGINNAIQISIGLSFSCATLANSVVKCWGRSDDGQLGNERYNGLVPYENIPIEVNGVRNVTQIGAGYNHACALLEDSTVTCWGRGDNGQLGNGTLSLSLPTLVIDGLPLLSIDSSSSSNDILVAGQNVHFSAEGQSWHGDLSYLWDFGGGATNLEIEDPGDVLFSQAGTYTITATATDEKENSVFDTHSLTIEEVPTHTSIEFEHNDALNIANDFSLTDVMIGNFSSITDLDFYQFSLNQETNIDFSFYYPQGTFQVVLLDANETTITETESFGMYQKKGRILTRLKAGQYYLKISSGENWKANQYYTFKTDLPLGQIVEAEPNDLANLANALNLEAEILGGISSSTDVDYYFFSLSQPKAISFSGQANPYDLELELYQLTSGENEDLIKRISILNDSSSANPEQILLASGTYGLKVAPLNSYSGVSSYSFTLTKSGDAVLDRSESLQDSVTLTLDNRESDTLFNSLDEDYYRLSLKRPRQLEIQFNTDKQVGDYLIQLFLSSEQNSFSSFTSENGSTKSALLGIGVGEYYFKVSKKQEGDHNANETYSLLVKDKIYPAGESHEIESNNTRQAATALTSQVATKGQLYSSADVDYFAFTQTHTGLTQIKFSAETDHADFKISLLNQVGSSLNTFFSIDGVEVNAPVGIRGGIHYLKVESAGDYDSLVEYNLTIDGTLEPLRSLVSLTLSEQNSLNVGEHLNLSTIANFSDASTEDVTHLAKYSSSDSTIATIDVHGRIDALKGGNVTLFVAYGGFISKKNISIGGAFEAPQSHGTLILLAGGGLSTANTLKTATQYLANLVYYTFQKRGFEDDDIYYFNPKSEHDLNGDGFFDLIVDNTVITKDSFEDVFQDWAIRQSSTGPLYVYLIDHGGIDKFELFPGEVLTASELNQYLTKFQTLTGREVIIIIEACKSGSFIDDLVRNKRAILTSTDSTDAYISNSGTVSFTQPLLNRLVAGDKLQEAFNYAQTKLLDFGRPYNRQKPQFTAGSGVTFVSRPLGGNFAVAGLFPEIMDHTNSQTVNAGEDLSLFTKISSLGAFNEVYALITPPDYSPPSVVNDLTAPEVTLPKVDLIDEDSSKILDGKYEGYFNDFHYNGVYQIVFYVLDENNSVIFSDPIEITVQNGQELSTGIEHSSNWKLVGFPFQLNSNDPSVLFSDQIDKILAIWSWEKNDWALWSPTQNFAAAYNHTFGTNFWALSTIKNNKGYWINLKEGENWNFNGVSTPITQSLTKGWNLVAFESGTVESTLAFLPNNIHSIWSWNGTTWEVYAPNSQNHQIGNYPILPNIETGKGYWIKVQ